MSDRTLRLKIKLVEPAPNYAYCLQRGKGAKAERLDYIEVLERDNRTVEFELAMTVRKAKDRPDPDFFGPFAQGTSGQRFFYVCVGSVQEAGDPNWSGRVKVPLVGLDWSIIERATAPGNCLFAKYQASNDKRQPVYASVRLLGEGWTLETADATAM